MQIEHQLQTGPEKGTSLALGYFDGVHVGHRAVLGAAVDWGRTNGISPAVFTFTGGAGGPKGKHLQTQKQKHRSFAEMGIEICFEPDFKSFHDFSPRDFLDKMVRDQYRAKAVFCGQDFYFGAGRAGNIALLENYCAEAGVHFMALPLAEWRGEPVSSSRIREALIQGDIPLANEMLGRPYEIDLPVHHGKGLGRTLGFPTINQLLPEVMQAPKFGVYITRTLIDGAAYPSATGYGTRPTVDGQEPTCETFIPGYAGDLYGREIRVEFYRYIDPVRRYSGPEELAAQVQKWAKQALGYFEDG